VERTLLSAAFDLHLDFDFDLDLDFALDLDFDLDLDLTLTLIPTPEEAIQTYDEVLRRFREARESALRDPVGKALVSKGITLGRLNRPQEARLSFQRVLTRFGILPTRPYKIPS
jgi:hypothetical protein